MNTQQGAARPKMPKSRIAGWALSALLAAFLGLVSAAGKFTEWDGKAEMFGALGWSESLILKIGIVEVVLVILFLVPRASFFGAVLLTGYLGGAVATHVRVGDPFVAPIVIGVIVWIALGLRDPRVFSTALRPAP